MVADLNPAAFLPGVCPLLVVKVGLSPMVQPDGARGRVVAGDHRQHLLQGVRNQAARLGASIGLVQRRQF